jgi:hypothetical protein
MRNVRDGGPVFPFEYHNQTSKAQRGFFVDELVSPGASQQFAGMTLRDYFAAKAMAGWLASYPLDTLHPASRGKEGDVAEMSYTLADAMLRAREANE